MKSGGRHGGAEVPSGAWDRLAELLSAPPGLETARLLQRAELLRPAPAAPRAPAAQPLSGRAGARPAPGRRRICLLGESAAAGFFYAPLLTPAKLLERQLAAWSAGGGAGAWEVVDRAYAGMQLDGLLEGTAAALQMEPDVVVVFAGNNWLGLDVQPSAYADGDLARFQAYADAVERRGPGALRRLADEAMRARARRAVDGLAALAAAAGVPLVFAVPAANLVDFESRQPVFWLAADGVARWHGLYRRAVAGLGRGDLAAAAAAAREMIELDGGDCATGHRLLASALLAQGHCAEAHAALTAHFDAACWDAQFGRGSSAPAPVREEILAGCRRHGVPCVDLPSIFAELTGSPLLDRRLFLDHCHLTVEGMHAAMAAVAAEVLRAVGAPVPGSWRELAALPPPEPPPPLAALSRLHAALYNAHRNQPAAGGQAPLAEALLEEALAAAGGAGASMREYTAAMAAPGRAFLTAACAQNQRSAFPLQPLAWLPSDLGIDALEPMARVLARHGGGIDLDRILLEHHAVDGGRRDLAAPRYREQEPGVSGTYALRQQPPSTFRALWPDSTFFLVTAGERDLRLDVTLRLPALGAAPAARAEAVGVSVNGSPAGAVQATESWRRETLRLPARSLRRGLNRLTLSWPLPRGAGDAAIGRAVRRLRQGLPADLYPVFGEVFSLHAGPPAAAPGEAGV